MWWTPISPGYRPRIQEFRPFSGNRTPQIGRGPVTSHPPSPNWFTNGGELDRRSPFRIRRRSPHPSVHSLPVDLSDQTQKTISHDPLDVLLDLRARRSFRNEREVDRRLSTSVSTPPMFKVVRLLDRWTIVDEVLPGEFVENLHHDGVNVLGSAH